MSNKSTLKLIYAGVCLALAIVLPFLTGQIPQIGNALCPMHIPVLLCGFLCGWSYGMIVGAVAPILRFAIFGMPVLVPVGIILVAMVAGRLVWGLAGFVVAGIAQTEFTFAAFLSGAVTNAIPGIILHIILVPIIIMALRKAQLVLNE